MAGIGSRVGRIDYEALIRFTQALVRVPSVNTLSHGLGEGPAAALVAAQMRLFGWIPLVEEAAPDRPNVIAVVEGGLPGPTLMFEGHTDVVTEGDADAWSYDPFGGEIVDGRLYGRGAADMKGGLAAMIFAAAALASEGPFPGRLLLAALADEEGMMLGAKDFVARGHGAEVAGVIVCEPEGGEVCIAQKGALRVWVEARGRMAHGAMPERGINPIPPLAAFTVACRDLELALQAEVGEHPLLGAPYVTPTVVVAGDPEQLNVIPGRAGLGVDVRTTPAVLHEQLVERMRAACGDGLSLSVLEDRPATETPSDHPIVRAVLEAHRRVHGSMPPLGGVPGATDGTILWREAGLPIVTYGPGDKWIAHQVDEHVEVEEVARAAEVYREAARLFLSVGTESRSARV
jgi:succinyl-diaminopimelate desuccinylase